MRRAPSGRLVDMHAKSRRAPSSGLRVVLHGVTEMVMEGREENLPVDGEETPTASCRTGREVHVVGLGEEVGHLEERDERDATFLWKRYVFEEVDLFGSWVTHRGPCVH